MEKKCSGAPKNEKKINFLKKMETDLQFIPNFVTHLHQPQWPQPPDPGTEVEMLLMLLYWTGVCCCGWLFAKMVMSDTVSCRFAQHSLDGINGDSNTKFANHSIFHHNGHKYDLRLIIDRGTVHWETTFKSNKPIFVLCCLFKFDSDGCNYLSSRFYGHFIVCAHCRFSVGIQQYRKH